MELMEAVEFRSYKAKLKEKSKLKTSPKDKGIGKELRETGEHEPKSTAYLKSILKSHWNVLEIGANIGYYAIIEAEKCRKVTCFEPIPENFKLLKENMERYENVELHMMGLGSYRGYENFNLSKMSNRHKIMPEDGWGVKLPITSIDIFIDENPQHFDFLRMDVEGAEGMIIAGGQRLLANDPPKWLFIEFHPIELGKAETSIMDLLIGLGIYGYSVKKVFYENSFKKIRPIDSLLSVLHNLSSSRNKKRYLKGMMIAGRKELEYDNIKDYVKNPVFNARASEVFLKHRG